MKKQETYEGCITFKKSKDPIATNGFVTDGFDSGYVSFTNADNTVLVNWFNKQTTSTEQIDNLISIRPRFECTKIHGEVWKGAYPILFHILDKGFPIVVKPKEYRKPVQISDNVIITDYKLLYERRDQLHCNDFIVREIKDNNNLLIEGTKGCITIKIEVKRCQVSLTNKQDKFTLLDLVCPLCDN